MEVYRRVRCKRYGRECRGESCKAVKNVNDCKWREEWEVRRNKRWDEVGWNWIKIAVYG